MTLTKRKNNNLSSSIIKYKKTDSDSYLECIQSAPLTTKRKMFGREVQQTDVRTAIVWMDQNFDKNKYQITKNPYSPVTPQRLKVLQEAFGLGDTPHRFNPLRLKQS